MTPERWQRIDELFHAALGYEPPQRANFLESACGDDQALRLEVETLISSHEEAEDFIETPAGDVAASLLSRQQPGPEPGQQVNHYKIVRQLGAGGMGEVYLADDVRLNRKIALKVLPAHFVTNPQRVRRFHREALAASALNHPNIVTIYEVGQADSTNFIASEFVDGKTLRELIIEKPLKLSESVNVALYVAGALAAAHAGGIVHRDIKPENIMIRVDGYVKILDFGLAKLVDLKTEAESDTLLQSNPGLVMGTVQYMSPEQARGKRVDARTDIWSLGVVLYELLAGCVPFTGETPSHVIVSLMEDEPPSLKDHQNVPPELDRIVTKALRKKPAERYQSASDMARDLMKLKQALELEKHLKGFREAVPPVMDKTASERRQVARAGKGAADATLTQPTTSAEYRPTSPARSSKMRALAVTAALVLAAIGIGSYALVQRYRSASTEAFQNIEFTRLTHTGKVKDAVISPDGKYLAYVAQGGGRQSIRLIERATPNDVEIVPPAEKVMYGATFSPDSNFVYYVVRERNNSIGVLHRVSVQGGVSTSLIVNIDSPVSFSPDSKQFAFVRGASGGVRSLIVANADGGEERKLVSRTGYEAFSFGGPAWLPDGKSIACGGGQSDETGSWMTIVAVEVADGSVRPLTPQKWRGIGRMAWLKDGKGLIFIASDHGRRSPAQIWYLEHPQGEARRITKDLHAYEGASLTSDSTLIVTNQTETIASLWTAPDNDANRSRQILTNNYDADGYGYYSRFSWTVGGQIVYTSQAQGTPSLWLVSDQGTGQKQLTNESSNNHFPCMTSDGRYVVFLSDRSGVMNVWRMDADGKNEMQLTKGKDDSWPWCSPDGQSVVYHSLIQGKRALHRVSINGGDAVQLTDYSSVCPTLSPDGQWISSYYRADPKAPWKIAIVRFDGGPPVRTFEIPPNVLFSSLVRWTPDGRALAYITSQDGISNIWIQPLDGSDAKQLTEFKSDEIFWFDWSVDGRQLGVSRGVFTSDVVLIKDLQPADR